MTTAIPCPRTLPFLGNVTKIEKDVPLRSYVLLSKQYGEIFRLMQFSRSNLVVSSYQLTNEVSDEKRFLKNPAGALGEVRNGVADGLFTAKPDEENWGIAHRLLMPAFGAASIKDMFDEMNDIASQLVLKWERFGSSAVLTPAEDFTRLAFDTIAYCSMSYRVNSFYRETNHPFIQAMSDFLTESMGRAFRPSVMTNMMGHNVKYEEGIKTLTELGNEIIADRKANPSDKNDLLNRMLNGKDSKTGKGLSDESIKNNLLTFLIAGHETTSGTLSFLTYYLCKSPQVMRKLRGEVDEVLGDQPPRVEDLGKLPYLTACLRETLRLFPPAPLRNVECLADMTIGDGRYTVKKGEGITVFVATMMRDPKVWGDDADAFKPERMLEDKFRVLPPNAWQPFGYGTRGCIGRAFFWQEALLTMSLLIQRFDLVMDDPSYELRIKHAMSIKPDGFHIRAIPRKERPASLAISPQKNQSQHGQVTATGGEGKQPMYVLYGSNTGTCEMFAQRIASDAHVHGFRANLGVLDTFANKLPTDGPIIIITASLEGEPADNAAHFVDWLTSLNSNELVDVKFGLFGCGNLDGVLEKRGAQRLTPRGEGDASAADFFESFDKWEVDLWGPLAKEYKILLAEDGAANAAGGLQMKTVDTGTARASVLRHSDVALGTVLENRLLTGPGTPPKRHLEFELPEGVAYQSGDYLAILPSNPSRDVHRVIGRFGLSAEQEIVLSASGPTPLPVGRPITIQALLSGYVELSQPATTRDLRILMTAENAPTAVLQTLTDLYAEKVLAIRLSVLDILEDHLLIKLPFLTYLQMLPSMCVRQYSISSSPLWNPSHITLTVSIVDASPRAGQKHPFLGVASTYLGGLHEGDIVQIAVKASSAAFHLPADPTVPIVMFAAGSGLAPMHGFLEERAIQKYAGREVGKSVLYFGCRSPVEDYLYADSDLKEWAGIGIVEVRPAFSRSPETSGGCKYVEDLAWMDRDKISQAYKANAKFYTCGSRKVAQGIKEVLIKIITVNQQVEDGEAEAIFSHMTQGRYAMDVFE